MSHRHLVLSVFPDENAADRAAQGLKESGMGQDDAIGVLVLDDKGKLKQDKMGARSIPKGAAIGGVLTLFGPAVLGVGLIAGGAAGALHHKNLGLSDEDKDRLTTELRGGKAALGVLAPEERAPGIMDWLTELGGTPETHALSGEAVDAASAAGRE
jgi:uncharacterized membrane protein